MERLLSVFEEAIDQEVAELHRLGVRLRQGRTDTLPERLTQKINSAVDLTEDNDLLIPNLAFNYGARAEIVDATRRFLIDGIEAASTDEELFSNYLHTAGLPAPIY